MAAKQAAKTRAATRERGKWPAGTRVAVDLRGAHPVAKGSMKAFTPTWKPGQKERPFAKVTDAKTPELIAFERDIRLLFARELDRLQLPCAHEQPFELLLVYYMARPGGDYYTSGDLRPDARAEPWTKPDLDKLERATLDALTGMVYDDDSRVTRVVKEKRYSTRERDVGLWVECRVRPATIREAAEAVQPKLI